MIVVDGLAFVATACIIGTYFLTATQRRPVIWFHWANFIGGIATGASAALHHAYPSLVLTGAFTIIGAIGVVAEWRKVRSEP